MVVFRKMVIKTKYEIINLLGLSGFDFIHGFWLRKQRSSSLNLLLLLLLFYYYYIKTFALTTNCPVMKESPLTTANFQRLTIHSENNQWQARLNLSRLLILSVRLSEWNNSAPTGRIFMKFDI